MLPPFFRHRSESGEAGSEALQLGKRYKSSDGDVEVLINKPGSCDLRYKGEPMELKEAKPLPSSD